MTQTNERKEAMCLQLREALTVGKISFVDQFFSNTASVKLIKQNCEDEMRNFCILVEASKTPFGKVKKTVRVSSNPLYLNTMLTPVAVLPSIPEKLVVATTT